MNGLLSFFQLMNQIPYSFIIFIGIIGVCMGIMIRSIGMARLASHVFACVEMLIFGLSFGTYYGLLFLLWFVCSYEGTNYFIKLWNKRKNKKGATA